MEAFNAYEAVLIHKEAKNKKVGGLRYCFATFAVQVPATKENPEGIAGERVYREGADADALERVNIGDVCTLSFEGQQVGLRTQLRCTGFTPRVGRRATLVISK